MLDALDCQFDRVLFLCGFLIAAVLRLESVDLLGDRVEVQSFPASFRARACVGVSLKKDAIFERNSVFRRRTFLLCHSNRPPIYDMRRFLDAALIGAT
jgi:hypothetical protein